MEKIVTKDWLKYRLLFSTCPTCGGVGLRVGFENNVTDCPICEQGRVEATPEETALVVGRALVAIYNNQTSEEKASVSTKYKNGVGFTGTDAKFGTRCAKHFAATKTLLPYMVKAWMVEKKGFPRICKYADQLNKIANEKKNEKVSI